MIDASYGDSTQLIYLRARYYNPPDGRFQSRDTWGGNYNSPETLNKWNYAHSNPINYTDPSGQCIFTGVDTAICIAALAIGIPIVAGVTTAAWDYAVSQGGGLGGSNWGQLGCIDWGQVANAGGSGSIAALEKMLAIPLAPDYLFAAWMGRSPTDANAVLLSYVGLENQYLSQQGNPYYIAGGYGGQAGATYISLATFFKGLPSIDIGSGTKLSGYNTLVISGYNVTIVGGNSVLVLAGTSGLTSSSLSMMMGSGGGSSGQIHHVLSNKIFRALNDHPNLKGEFNREEFRVQAANKLDHSGYQTWHREYDIQVTTWLAEHPNVTRQEFIAYLRGVYSSPQLQEAFPNALGIIK